MVKKVSNLEGYNKLTGDLKESLKNTMQKFRASRKRKPDNETIVVTNTTTISVINANINGKEPQGRETKFSKTNDRPEPKPKPKPKKKPKTIPTVNSPNNTNNININNTNTPNLFINSNTPSTFSPPITQNNNNYSQPFINYSPPTPTQNYPNNFNFNISNPNLNLNPNLINNPKPTYTITQLQLTVTSYDEEIAKLRLLISDQERMKIEFTIENTTDFNKKMELHRLLNENKNNHAILQNTHFEVVKLKTQLQAENLLSSSR